VYRYNDSPSSVFYVLYNNTNIINDTESTIAIRRATVNFKYDDLHVTRSDGNEIEPVAIVPMGHDR